MAIENNKSLVQFGYAINKDASTTAGFITFDSGKQAIYVGDGTVANLVTSSVKDATYVDNVLTITKIDGTQHILNFSDVASAKQTMAVFTALETAIKANETAISNLSSTIDTSIKALDASYKAADASLKEAYEAADASLSERIAAFESGDNSVATQIANAIDGLDSSANSDNDFFTLEVVEENGKVTSVNFTNKDVASATALAEVKTTADNAAKNSDLTAHTGNGDIHVTKDQKDAWQAATDKVEAFFNDAVIDNADTLKDTLKEIQDYIASDASAAATMTSNITKAQETADQAVLDASAAQAAADAAQIDVDAVEEALGSGFSRESTVSAQLAAVKNTADAAAVKTSVDASLDLKADKTALAATDASLKTVTDSYVISFGGAKGEISVDTNNNNQGEVKFRMDGSTLKGAVNGLGSAAFEASTAFDASGSAAAAQAAAINAVTGSADDASNVKTIEGTRKYAEELVANVPTATVTGVNSESKADAKGYVTIALELNNKNVAVKSIAVDTQAIATADDTENDGLATAYDVKQYVDAKDASMDARMDAVEAQLKWIVL